MINITKIYLITNIGNNPNKVYIGKTKNSRKNNHKKTYGNQIIYTIIDEIHSLNRKDWEPLETYWIEQFRQWGFEIVNKNKGGGGPITHTDESRKKMRYNRPYLYKSVLQYDLNGNILKEWDNISNASLFLNKPGCAIVETCLNKRKSAYGFIWRYKNEPLNQDYIYSKNKPYKPIIQYDMCGCFIKKWDSIKEASHIINIHTSNISSCCRGKQKSAGGYIWKYKEN
jgi:hypothetical protein